MRITATLCLTAALVTPAIVLPHGAGGAVAADGGAPVSPAADPFPGPPGLADGVRPMLIPQADPAQLAASAVVPLWSWQGASPPAPPMVLCASPSTASAPPGAGLAASPP